jgi:hypothetical protein
LAGDKGVVRDLANAQLIRHTVKDRLHIADRTGAIANAVNLNERLQPMHPPRGGALNLGTRFGKGSGDIVCATSQRQRVI